MSIKKSISAMFAVVMLMSAAVPAFPANALEENSYESASADERVNKKLLNVSNIMQYPELPTGCESVALTILLNHLGYKADKLTIARDYLPKLDFYWYNGVLYGADFRTTFAGNPESEYAYGCYAQCITTTANNYLNDNGFGGKAYNITGSDFDSLLYDYIDNSQDIKTSLIFMKYFVLINIFLDIKSFYYF